MLSLFAIAALLMLASVDILATGKEPPQLQADRFARWEEAIGKFEQQDKTHPAEPGGIVFVGSSSIHLWNLDKWFEGVEPPPLNRGFGGSQIADATHFADRLVLKHKPRLIVFYSGDNDIASGKSAKKVAADFSEFCKDIHDKLPEARIVFISIKPSPARWKFAKTALAANDAIREQCESDEQLDYVDVWTPMLGSDGQPRPELFGNDKLHMNDAGYKLWTQLVKPLLTE